MTEAEVTEVLACLQRAGLDLWIDGGWGVDALLGAQTRDHDDLDLAMNRDDVGVAGMLSKRLRTSTIPRVSRAFLRASSYAEQAADRWTSIPSTSTQTAMAGNNFRKAARHGGTIRWLT
jgi:hypothetical protein